MGSDDKQCALLRHAAWHGEACNSLQAPRTNVEDVLLHGNPLVYTAVHVMLQTPQHLRFEVLEHPPFSPDLVSLDYNLFGHLKNILRRCRFAGDTDLEAGHAWISGRLRTFFSKACIQKHVQRWTKCVEKQG
jgi:hypothetical protein